MALGVLCSAICEIALSAHSMEMHNRKGYQFHMYQFQSAKGTNGMVSTSRNESVPNSSRTGRPSGKGQSLKTGRFGYKPGLHFATLENRET